MYNDLMEAAISLGIFSLSRKSGNVPVKMITIVKMTAPRNAAITGIQDNNVILVVYNNRPDDKKCPTEQKH